MNRSMHTTVTSDGMVEFQSKISARLMFMPLLVVTGGTKVRKVKSM